MKIKVGDKEFNIDQATTPEELKKGLSGKKDLPKGSGLLLSFSKADRYPITMKDMQFPLTLVFEDGGKVIDITTLNPGDSDYVGKLPYTSVLEINPKEAEGIKHGNDVLVIGKKNDDGTVDIADGNIEPKGVAHILDENGKVQMNLLGSERVFSRKATEKIFDLAKSNNYKKLAKFVFKEIQAQDDRPEEYSKN